jgi:hypothetical protein
MQQGVETKQAKVCWEICLCWFYINMDICFTLDRAHKKSECCTKLEVIVYSFVCWLDIFNDSFYCTISPLQTMITTHVVSLNSTLFITCLMEWYSNEYSPIMYSLYQWSVIYRRYKNLLVKSVSLNLFNLLGSSSASSVDASSFGFCGYFVSVLDVEFFNFFSNCWYL